MDIKKLAKRDMSQQLIADYKPFTMVDGEGFRCAIYVSGCIFNCKGCYNKSIQDFGNGKSYAKELEARIIKDLSHEKVQGLTLLGGEPFLNTDVCLSLCKRVRSEFGNTRDIWAWTGYTYEELQESIECNTVNSGKQSELLSIVDVLIDGRYVEEQKDFTGRLKFRGSWNQKIIDVQKSISNSRLTLWENDYEL